MLQRSLMGKNNQNPAGDKSRRSHSWQSLTDDSLLIETIINIGPPPKRNPDPFQCMESRLSKQTSQPKKNSSMFEARLGQLSKYMVGMEP